jgi:hypothetical protein
VSDFLTDLRGDLVDAHARYGQRGRAGRLARPVHPRTWRPAAIVAAAVAAAAVAVGVLGVRAVHNPTPASLRIVARVSVGGAGVGDATLGFGNVWTVDAHNGVVTQIDPVHARVVRRFSLDLVGDSIRAGAGALWVTTAGNASGESLLLRVDPRTGRVTATRQVPSFSTALAVGDDTVWLLDTQTATARLRRVDPATGRIILTVPTRTSGDAIAVGGDSLWTLDGRGVLTQRDARTGRALRRVSGLGSSSGAGEKVLTADATGVWAVRPGALVRVASGGSVVRRVPLPANALTLFAEGPGELWLARGAGGLNPQLLRFDRGTGKPTGSLDLGSHQPQALVPSPRGLWVVCVDGTALLVR